MSGDVLEVLVLGQTQVRRLNAPAWSPSADRDRDASTRRRSTGQASSPSPAAGRHGGEELMDTDAVVAEWPNLLTTLEHAPGTDRTGEGSTRARPGAGRRSPRR